MSAGKDIAYTLLFEDDFDPEEVESIAQSALSGPWVAWFRKNKFSYEPKDRSFFKKFNDPARPSWSYVYRVVPQISGDSVLFDVYWRYIDEDRMDTYGCVVYDYDVSASAVQGGLTWGEQKIRDGSMHYEAMHI